MSVTRIMTKDVVSVGLDESLRTVHDIFQQQNFHHLLVVEEDKLIGVISDRDLNQAISPFVGTLEEQARDLVTLNLKAQQIMSRDPIVVTAKDSIFKAIKIFNRNTISCIPVVDEQGKPIGIISWRDVLRYSERLVKERKHGKSAGKKSPSKSKA